MSATFLGLGIQSTGLIFLLETLTLYLLWLKDTTGD